MVRFVRLADGDSGEGLPLIFRSDTRDFVPQRNNGADYGGGCLRWGLPEVDENMQRASMMRTMSMQFVYRMGTVESPEVQFVNVLVARKRAALAALPAVPASRALVLRVALVRLWPALRELEPFSVWRKARVQADLNLNTMHDRVLGPLMGWTRNYHAYHFTDLKDGAMWCPLGDSGAIDMMHAGMHVISALDPKETRLGELLRKPGDRLLYTYDLGDQFAHLITLEEIEDGNSQKGCVVLDGAMRCPNEDGDGCRAYEEEVLEPYLEASLSPEDDELQREFAAVLHPRRESLNVRESRGRFDVKEFSVKNRQLAVDAAFDSRSSAQTGAKQFYMSPSAMFGGESASFGHGEPDVTDFLGLEPGQRAVRVGSMTETVNIKPDDREDAVCARCGKQTNLSRCGKCRALWYCSRECQKADWPKHKKVCGDENTKRKTYKQEKKQGSVTERNLAPSSSKPDRPTLRFKLNTRVECRLSVTPQGSTFAKGHVVDYQYYEPHMQEPAPYQVRLDDGNYIYAIQDDDFCIRKVN